VPGRPRVIRLDEIEAVPGPGTLTWLPVRMTLGIRAFGCNAYVAGDAGEDVVEPHSEDPALAHEELYYVARGRATFTIDGQTYEASAGTYVFIPDPASNRHAVAAEAGTTVLSFGGPPTFEPSAWEWTFRAAALQRTDPAKARELLEDGLRVHRDSAALLYGLACAAAVGGDPDEALAQLGRAIEFNADARGWARDDQDFEGLRGDERFSALVDG